MSDSEMVLTPTTTGAVLEGLLWVGLFALAVAYAHAGPVLVAVFRRGRAYRRRMRNARHRNLR